MYLFLLLLFILIVVLVCKATAHCVDADSEPEQFQVPATTNPVTNSDSRLSMETNAVHRNALGIILIDDNNTYDADGDDIDLNANSSSLDGGSTRILSADFGDNNVHPMEEGSCSICLINYQHGDRIQRNAFDCFGDCDHSNIKDRCDHVFHPECISSWIKTNTGDGECPICRRPFVLSSPV
jgi:hypothetical protein